MKINKLLILFGVAIIFLVGTINIVNALEFDNVKNYDEETKTIEIRNSVLGIPFLQLGKVAEIELKTPQNYLVTRGYQKVAEFEINLFTDYDLAFKELELYDKNNGDKKFVRDYDYKYKTIQQVPDYKTVCDESFSKNGTVEHTNCRQEQIGLKDEVMWVDLGLSNFKDGDVKIIGIFTNVQPGDRVEWIPNFFGVRINEWSIWTESLNVDILGYWKFNETSGVVLDSTGNNFDGSNNGSTRGATGIIENAFSFDGVDDDVEINSIVSTFDALQPFTINYWQNGGTAATNENIYTIGNIASSSPFVGLTVSGTGNNVAFSVRNDANSIKQVANSSLDLKDGNFHMLTGVFNGSDYRMYMDGNLSGITSGAVGGVITLDLLTIGARRLGTNATSVFWNGTFDELGIWNRSLNSTEVLQLFNNGSAITFRDVFGPIITLVSPEDVANITTNNVTFNVTVIDNPDSTPIENVTLFIDGILNETNSSGFNGDYIFEKNLSVGSHNWSIRSIDNSSETSNSPVRTFTIGSTVIGFTFNSTSLETARETYIVNITSFDSGTPTNATLNFAGTEVSATVTGIGGDNFTISATQDVPTGIGERTFNFTFNVNGDFETTLSNNQTVNETILALCNSTIGTSYINFTFRNETLAEENVNATVDTSWNFFLGSGTTTKTFSLSNATENPSYAFCVEADNRTLSTQVNVSYTNSISQQRQFRPTLLTLSNITLNQVLFLLPTSEGIFSQFRTQDNIGNTLVGVLATITRILNGNPITSGIDVTDGAGLVSFFLDPDTTYTASFTFTGFNDNTFNFNPTSDLTTIVMGGIAAAGNGSNISLGTSYAILPINSTLQNGTDVSFQFNVSSLETITFMGFNISNGTTTLLLVNQTSNGSISGIINTGTNRTFIGVFTFNTSGESITITRIWPILEGFLGDYSIQRQGDLFLTYEFSDFIRLLIIVGFIIAVMIFISAPNDPEDELRIAVMIAMVWFFSFIGWLDTGLQVTTASSNINALTQFSNQFGIAILTTATGFYFILRRTLRQI